jgi:hypothetical protein
MEQMPCIVSNSHGSKTRPLTLADLHRLFCYDPETGFLFLRRSTNETHPMLKLGADMPPTDPSLAKGIRIDRPGYAGTRVLRHGGRDYPVHMLATFLALGRWMPPRFVKFVNGDQTNPAWENLNFEGKPGRFKFWAPTAPETPSRDRRRNPMD